LIMCPLSPVLTPVTSFTALQLVVAACVYFGDTA